MTVAAILTALVAALLLAVRHLVRFLERTRHGVEFEGMFREVYTHAPESAGEDQPDRTEG